MRLFFILLRWVWRSKMFRVLGGIGYVLVWNMLKGNRRQEEGAKKPEAPTPPAQERPL